MNSGGDGLCEEGSVRIRGGDADGVGGEGGGDGGHLVVGWADSDADSVFFHHTQTVPQCQTVWYGQLMAETTDNTAPMWADMRAQDFDTAIPLTLFDLPAQPVHSSGDDLLSLF